MLPAIRDRLRQAQFLEGLTDSALHQLSKLVTRTTFVPAPNVARDFLHWLEAPAGRVRTCPRRRSN